MNDIVGGIIELKINGEIYSAKGNFTYNLGNPKYEPVLGSDRLHGFKGSPQAPRIEGEITDNDEMSLDFVTTIKDATATLSLANGKVFVLKGARYCAEGDAQTEEGNIQLLLYGTKGEEVR